MVQIDFILLFEYQGRVLPPRCSPADKQAALYLFFVYGNYCQRIVPYVTRLTMSCSERRWSEGGARGDGRVEAGWGWRSVVEGWRRLSVGGEGVGKRGGGGEGG